jgi:hypothetical protein
MRMSRATERVCVRCFLCQGELERGIWELCLDEWAISFYNLLCEDLLPTIGPEMGKLR